MTKEQTKSQYKSGVIMSYIAFIVSAIVGFVLPPFLISHLGNELNGLYNALTSFSVYFAMLDFGLGATILRFVAKYRVENRENDIYSFLSVIRKIYVIICLAVLVSGSVISIFVPSIFAKSIPADYERQAVWVFLMAICSIAVTIYGNLFYSTIRAYEQFAYARGTAILQDFLRVGFIVLLLELGFSITAVAFSDLCSNCIIMLTRMIYTKRKLGFRFVKAKISKERLKEIFNFSIYIVIYSLVQKVFWQLDKVVLGIMVGGLSVTIYSLGAQISSSVESVSSTISSMYVPHAVKTISKSDSHQYLDVSAQMGRYQLFVMVPVLIGFMLFGQEFISLWMGEGYHESYYIALVLVVALIPVLIQSYPEAMLKAVNKQKFYTIAILVATLLNIVLTVMLVPAMGALGAALASAITNIGRCGVMAWYFMKTLNISITMFARKSFKGYIIAIPIMLLSGFGIGRIMPGHGWSHLVIEVVVFGLLYCAMAYGIIFNQTEKKKMQEIIGKAKRRILKK